MPLTIPLVGTMPSISLKTIVIIHWFLFVWATLWGLTPAYQWCNFSVLALGVWAVADRQSVDALLMFIVTLLLSVIVDIVVLATYFPLASTGIMKFSVAMCIINLILKPFSAVLLYQMYRDRGGEYNMNFGPNSSSYDRIGDDSTGSSADIRNVLQPARPSQPAYVPPNTGYNDKEQPLV